MALTFPGLFGGGDKTLQTADYRTAGSHQVENLNFMTTAVTSTWVEIHTVTTGKTYYVTAVIMHTNSVGAVHMEIGIGAPASEATIMQVIVGTDMEQFKMTFPTPIKFSSGTRISGRMDSAGTYYWTLVGWEE